MFTIKVGDDFLINQILECGQCFRYKKLDEMSYRVIAKGLVLHVKQDGQELQFDCDEEVYDDVWRDYFDMERDYVSVMDGLRKKDHYLKEAIMLCHGVRILQQDVFEMLITFILSQNKSIPQISVLVDRLAENYGEKIETDLNGLGGLELYSFPSSEQMQHATEEELRALKVGFRAPYIIDAVEKVVNGSVNLKRIHHMDTVDAREMLMSIKGVGRKVADCVLLFGCGKMDVFPIDVWVRRIMQATYFKDKQVSNSEMLDFAESYFEGVSGIAQQYLFYYARTEGIGK